RYVDTASAAMLTTRSPITAIRRACIMTIIAAGGTTWVEKISNHASFRSGALTPGLVPASPRRPQPRRTAGKCDPPGSGESGRQGRELGQGQRLGPTGRVHTGRLRGPPDDVQGQSEPGAERVGEHLSALGERRAHHCFEAPRVGE